MMTSREKIRKKALEILADTPKGIRYSDLMRRIQEELPNIPFNTITGSVWNLDIIKPEEIYKPGRGIFRHTKFKEAEAEEEVSEEEVIETSTARIKEEDFYS